MKNFFLSIFFFTASVSLYAAGVHVPAAGPVQLGDPVGVLGGTARGAIMQAVTAHNPANPQANPILASANIAIANFDGQGQNFRSYQAIVARIGQSVNADLAIEAVKAFERVLMYLYDYDVYMIGGYKPGLSMVIPSGIRWSWIKPWSYFAPKSYFSDNNTRCKQLIDELDKLADVVKIHSISEYVRLKTTVHSYRHWRRNVMLAIAAYLAADMYKHGYDDSIINEFYQGGLSNSGAIAINHIMNLGSGVRHLGTGLKIGIHALWSYGISPAGKFIFGGAAAFKKDDKNDQLVKPKVNAEKKLNEKVEKVKKNVLDNSGKTRIDHEKEMQDFENIRFNAGWEESLKYEQADASQIMPVQEPSMPIWSSLCQIFTTEKELREQRKKLTFDKIGQLKQATLGNVLKWQQERKKKLNIVENSKENIQKSSQSALKNMPKTDNNLSKSNKLNLLEKPKNVENRSKVKDLKDKNIQSKNEKQAFKDKILALPLDNMKQQYESDQKMKNNFFDGCASCWNKFKSNMFYSDEDRKKLERATEFFRNSDKII